MKCKFSKQSAAAIIISGKCDIDYTVEVNAEHIFII